MEEEIIIIIFQYINRDVTRTNWQSELFSIIGHNKRDAFLQAWAIEKLVFRGVDIHWHDGRIGISCGCSICVRGGRLKQTVPCPANVITS